MPIALSQMQNPWVRTQVDARGRVVSRALEPQRSDLFTVDFSRALDAIRVVLGREQNSDRAGIADLIEQLPTREELIYFPCAVDFAEAKVVSATAKRHEVPLPYPGLEEAYGQVTVTFTQDAPEERNLRASRAMAFLRGWRAIVRAGRAGSATGDISLDLLGASVDGSSLIPHFRHDFKVQLWRGAAPTESSTQLFDGQKPGYDQLPTCEPELAAEWSVRGAWLLGFQPNSLDHSQAAVQKIRATFAAEAVTEGVSPGVQVGAARSLGTF